MPSEAKTFITLEQVRKRICYRICQNIAAWLNGADPPNNLEDHCNKGQLSYWELADLVFETAQDLVLNEDNQMRLKSNQFKSPREYSLYDELVLYAGAFPFLIANKIDFSSWEGNIVIRLEATLQGDNQLREIVFKTVQSLLLKVLILRACGCSWDAAEVSIGSEYKKHFIYGISKDLERRSLTFESQRMKAKFLGVDIKDKTYFPGLLDTDGPLVKALCDEFIASLDV